MKPPAPRTGRNWLSWPRRPLTVPDYTQRNNARSRSAHLNQRSRASRDDHIRADPTAVGRHSWQHRARTVVEQATKPTGLVNTHFGHNLNIDGRDYIHRNPRDTISESLHSVIYLPIYAAATVGFACVARS